MRSLLEKPKTTQAVQPRLAINTPGDRYEREADEVAGRVMDAHAPSHTSAISRLSSSGVQAKQDSIAAPQLTPDLTADVQALQSGGNPLPPQTRGFFESQLHTDFSHVRVNTDTRAQDTARSLGARAFTVGNSISFGAGQYAPESREGKRLLAHELTHVVQQGGGNSNVIQRDPLPQQEAQAQQKAQPQKAPSQATIEKAAPKIKFQFGILVQEDVETNQQVVAIARLAIISLRDDMENVTSSSVKAQVNEWIATIEGALPYFQRHAAEKVDPVWIPFINYEYDKLLEVQEAVRTDKLIQIKEAMWREHDAAVKAAEEAEALQPKLDDAMRAAYRGGSSSTLKEVVSTVKSSINIGRNIRALAAGIQKEIFNLPLASGTKVFVDHWSSQIGRPKITIINVGKYTESLNKLGRGLAAINAVLTLADRSKKATMAEQGMKDLSDAFNIGTDLISASPFGAPPHFSLYSTLYMKPMLKVISMQIGMLVENLSDINRTAVGVTGKLLYPNAEPGGQEMFDVMVKVMHADSESGVPSLSKDVQKYLYEHREKLGIGAEANVPIEGSLWWKGFDAVAGRKWLFSHRREVWAMFYGSMMVPGGRP